MPPFAPGESKIAVATFPVKPAGLPCAVELWLARDSAKAARSGEVPFVSTGADLAVSLPITMPDIEGTYPVNLDVLSGGQLIAAYQAQDVVVEEPVGIATLSGQVTDKVTGATLASVYVGLYLMNRRTDPWGRYSFANVPPGNYNIEFIQAGYYTHEVGIILGVGAHVYDVQMDPLPPPILALSAYLQYEDYCAGVPPVCWHEYITGIVIQIKNNGDGPGSGGVYLRELSGSRWLLIRSARFESLAPGATKPFDWGFGWATEGTWKVTVVPDYGGGPTIEKVVSDALTD